MYILCRIIDANFILTVKLLHKARIMHAIAICGRSLNRSLVFVTLTVKWRYDICCKMIIVNPIIIMSHVYR